MFEFERRGTIELECLSHFALQRFLNGRSEFLNTYRRFLQTAIDRQTYIYVNMVVHSTVKSYVFIFGMKNGTYRKQERYLFPLRQRIETRYHIFNKFC